MEHWQEMALAGLVLLAAGAALAIWIDAASWNRETNLAVNLLRWASSGKRINHPGRPTITTT
jgi:hypothetical protein